MRTGLNALRAALVVTLVLCLWKAAIAKATDVEYPMVPSARWGATSR
jgi:hypothetical protein